MSIPPQKGVLHVSASRSALLSKSVCHAVLAAHLEDQCSPIASKYCFVEASAHGTPVSRRDLCITMSKPKYPVLYILKYDPLNVLL